MNKRSVFYLLGAVLGVEGIFLLGCCVVDLFYKEGVFSVYFGVALICLVIGFFSFKERRKAQNFYAKEGLFTVALCWILLAAVGAIPLMLTGECTSFIDAFFEMTSGFTTTGSTIFPQVELLSHATLFWRSVSHWIGGMGVLVFVLAILPAGSGSAMHVMRAESPGPSVGKLVSKLSDTAKILYAIYAGLTLLELILLVVFGMPFFDALCTSFATAGTGGFSNYSTSMGLYSMTIRNTVAIFMIIFGVNFNVYYLILIRRFKDAFHCEELKHYLLIIGAAIILITINILDYYPTLMESFSHALFQVSSIITTTGFASTDFELWPTFSRTILVALMIVGACAGSTGGGLKVSRVAIMLKDIKNTILRQIQPKSIKTVRYEDKIIPKETLNGIRTYISIYILIFALSVLIISIDNLDFTTNFTAVAATFNNIGPGLNMVGPAGNFSIFSGLSKLVLSFDMLAGRLELIPMLVLFFPKTYSKI